MDLKYRTGVETWTGSMLSGSFCGTEIGGLVREPEICDSADGESHNYSHRICMYHNVRQSQRIMTTRW